jgi:molybdopterin-guanine dinucleotide biosynthesis protein B
MATESQTPTLSIVGLSGSGKTTLLVKLIPELEKRGYRIAVIKHHPDPGLDLDTPGKDTWRLFQAGAAQVTLAAPDQVMHRIRLDEELGLEAIVASVQNVGLILTEGYKGEQVCKIEVVRSSEPPTLVSRPDELVAIASDQPLDLSVPQFSLNDVSGLADFIESQVLSGSA